MASREKRALAPSKSKQKANNDSSSLSADSLSSNSQRSSNSSKKGASSSLASNPRSQLARDIFEAVATGSQLPAKLEASLPRKRAALQTALKRKQKAKKTLIKVKQKVVPIKSLKRIADKKKILNKKKKKKRQTQQTVSIKKEPQSNDSSFNDSLESEDTKSKSKGSKKSRSVKSDDDRSVSSRSSSVKPSPKTVAGAKKLTPAQKRQDSKERDTATSKAAKQRSLSKEIEPLLTARQIKQEQLDDTYDLTIEEVIASSMHVEHGLEQLEAADESGKRKAAAAAVLKRSLRNGKLRQQSATKAETDSDRPQQQHKRAMSSDALVVEPPTSEKVEEDQSSQPLPAAQDAGEGVTPVVYNHNNTDSDELQQQLPVEANNNGCDSEEIGPTLRSKTKARDSKSEDEAVTKPVAAAATAAANPKTLVAEAKTQLLQPRSRRSSLNVSSDNSNSNPGSSMKRFAPLPVERMVDGSNNIDEMIDKIKLSIVKTIESKIYKTDAKGGLIVGAIEVPKLEEIIAPLTSDVSKIEAAAIAEKEEKNKEISTGVGPNSAKKEMKKDDAESAAPKLAKTAKEIERLVMGDEEQPSDSQSAAKEKSSEKSTGDSVAADPPAAAAAVAVVTVAAPVATEFTDDKEQEKEKEKDKSVKEDSQDDGASQQSTESSVELTKDPIATKDVVKPVEEVKKPVAPTRKSARVSAGKSSLAAAAEIRKSVSVADISKELEKLDEEEKASESVKTPDVTAKHEEDETKAAEEVASKASTSEVGDSTNDKKTAKGASADAAEATESSAKKASEDEKMVVDELAEADKPEETLESLSRDVERLVEEDNDKIMERAMDSVDNDVESSDDIEMRLMIDEDVPEESTPEESESNCSEQKTNNKDGCDHMSSIESADVQKDEAVAVPTSGVQENPETETTDIATVTATSSPTPPSPTTPPPPPPPTSPPLSSPPPPPPPPPITTTITTTTTTNVTSKSPETDEKSKVETTAVVAVKAKSTETAEEVEEQKETRRVLRARGDKQKKVETAKSTPAATAPVTQEKHETKVAKSEDAATSEVPSTDTQENTETAKVDQISQDLSIEAPETKENLPVVKIEMVEELPEPQIRTRRSREVKRLPVSHAAKNKRGPKKHDAKRNDSQHQAKEESLLDNEVAKINENRRSSSYHKTEENRGVSADAGNTEQQQKSEAAPATKSRSKSENDVRSTNLTSEELKPKSCSPRPDIAEGESTGSDSKEPPKDTDEASSSGESLSSIEKFLETPEDKRKKEDVLSQLGLMSWERVKERTAKKEQDHEYTGTLKTIIKLGKGDKDGKKRSRSPLKMVLKQQGRAEGEEAIDYYTIQKEMGTSGLGDSSSGANRKLSTNHRHSCGKHGCGPLFNPNPYRHAWKNEDNDDGATKDRASSLVIPEKSSSFDIHPGRLCADNCCYCHGKFGSLDTPMHLAQMKSSDRRMKILKNEQHLTKDSCLCDACYRHVDRKINDGHTHMQLKPHRQPRQHPPSKCMAIGCTEMARHHVKRRWLNKIRMNIKHDVEVGWESSQHNLLTFCGFHYSKIEPYLLCSLCSRRLTRNCTYPLSLTVAAAADLSKRVQNDGVPANLIHNGFICKLCKYFLKLYGKSGGPDGSTETNRNFFRNYRRKLRILHDIQVSESEEEVGDEDHIEEEEEEEERIAFNQSVASKSKEKERDSGKGKSKDKERDKDRDKNRSASSNKKSKANTSITKVPTFVKLPGAVETESPSTSEKSTPEPPKVPSDPVPNAIASTSSGKRAMRIEGTIEKLKKRKALDSAVAGPSSRSEPMASNENGRNVVEILAMDKEVTLTRLPKRPRLTNNNNNTPNNDITPVVQRLGANPSISVRTLFPGEEEMNLHASVEFNNVREVTPQGWEKCATMIQYDRDTKMLWQELQRPYGNQSSFLRHLILLEKYYRAGDLILAPNASRNAINYSTSVQNRLISYKGPEKRTVAEDNSNVTEASEYNNSRRLSGGYVLEQHLAIPSTSTPMASSSLTSQLSKLEASSRVMKLTPGVSIIKKPPPNLQRLPLIGGVNGSAKRKEMSPVQKGTTSASVSTPGGRVFQLSEPEFKKLQNLKRQKQLMNDRQGTSSPSGSGMRGSGSPPINYRNATTAAAAAAAAAQYQKAQQMQFQKHLRMQQEMLNQRSRGDFEPLVCDIRLSNENTPTQNLINLNNLNLPKSIQVTTKTTSASTSNHNLPIPILPKIPKSLTVIPQTVARNHQNK